MKNAKRHPLSIPQDAYQPIGTPTVVNIAGDLWAISDGTERCYVNLDTQKCTCDHPHCVHIQCAKDEAEHMRDLGFDVVPDTDSLAILAIQRGLRLVREGA